MTSKSARRRDVNDIPRIVKKKLELYINYERRENRFDTQGASRTTPRMHMYDYVYRVLENTELEKQFKKNQKNKENRKEDHRSKSPYNVRPQLIQNSRRVVGQRETQRLSANASQVLESLPLEKLYIIHRYRPYCGDIPLNTNTGKIQNYSRHVGCALHSENFIRYYKDQGLDSGSCNESPRLQKLAESSKKRESDEKQRREEEEEEERKTGTPHKSPSGSRPQSSLLQMVVEDSEKQTRTHEYSDEEFEKDSEGKSSKDDKSVKKTSYSDEEFEKDSKDASFTEANEAGKSSVAGDEDRVGETGDKEKEKGEKPKKKSRKEEKSSSSSSSSSSSENEEEKVKKKLKKEKKLKKKQEKKREKVQVKEKKLEMNKAKVADEETSPKEGELVSAGKSESDQVEDPQVVESDGVVSNVEGKPDESKSVEEGTKEKAMEEKVESDMKRVEEGDVEKAKESVEPELKTADESVAESAKEQSVEDTVKSVGNGQPEKDVVGRVESGQKSVDDGIGAGSDLKKVESEANSVGEGRPGSGKGGVAPSVKPGKKGPSVSSKEGSDRTTPQPTSYTGQGAGKRPDRKLVRAKSEGVQRGAKVEYRGRSISVTKPSPLYGSKHGPSSQPSRKSSSARSGTPVQSASRGGSTTPGKTLDDIPDDKKDTLSMVSYTSVEYTERHERQPIIRSISGNPFKFLMGQKNTETV